MARITGSAAEKVFSIQRWLGLNENPDGDTKLKMGEASLMRNMRVTRDGNLQKRPGTRAVLTVAAGKKIDAVWTGVVAGEEVVMAIADDKLFNCWEQTQDGGDWVLDEVGGVGFVDRPFMFGFSERLYILTGREYYVWDGQSLSLVEGYVPLVAVAVPPAGGGELLEQVNKLTGCRRAWFSPDGTATAFQLPETGILRVRSVKKTDDWSEVTGWTLDASAGVVTFPSAPARGVSSIEITWEINEDFRDEICAMHYAETYNGTQDTRVFLYGDGSNTAIYSDLDHDGKARADYFPDQNEVRVGVANTPITGMIRHYSALVAFKTDGAYSIQYGVITLADSSVTAAFYVQPLNRVIGNEAPGQVQLVLNNPLTLFGQDVYEWRNGNRYASGLSQDERQARRASDRVYSTLHSFDTKRCVCFDDNYRQEYYICDPSGRALVYGYAADAWYYYTDFPMKRPFAFRNELYYGADDGRIYRVSTGYSYDQSGEDGALQPIDCYWESGAMSFGADYQRKNSAMLWIGIKPEAKASVDVTVLTDKEATYAVKTVDYSLFDFEHIDFSDFTFSTNDKPQMRRLKIKAKKFVFYKLVLKSNTDNTGFTLTSADIRVRFMGYAKG